MTAHRMSANWYAFHIHRITQMLGNKGGQFLRHIRVHFIIKTPWFFRRVHVKTRTDTKIPIIGVTGDIQPT